MPSKIRAISHIFPRRESGPEALSLVTWLVLEPEGSGTRAGAWGPQVRTSLRGPPSRLPGPAAPNHPPPPLSESLDVITHETYTEQIFNEMRLWLQLLFRKEKVKIWKEILSFQGRKRNNPITAELLQLRLPADGSGRSVGSWCGRPASPVPSASLGVLPALSPQGTAGSRASAMSCASLCLNERLND